MMGHEVQRLPWSKGFVRISLLLDVAHLSGHRHGLGNLPTCSTPLGVSSSIKYTLRPKPKQKSSQEMKSALLLIGSRQEPAGVALRVGRQRTIFASCMHGACCARTSAVICIYIYMHVYIFICLHILICLSIFISLFTHTCTYMRIYLPTYKPTYPSIYLHMYVGR